MIAKPTTADQAITNAILAVEEAERWVAATDPDIREWTANYRHGQVQAYTAISEAWSKIAEQLPTMEHIRALNDLIDDGGTVE